MPRSPSVSNQRTRPVMLGSAAKFARVRTSANCGPAADCGQNPHRPRDRVFLNNNALAKPLWDQDRDGKIRAGDQNWPQIAKRETSVDAAKRN